MGGALSSPVTLQPTIGQYERWAEELRSISQRAQELLSEAELYGAGSDLTASVAVNDLRHHANYWNDCAVHLRREARL